MGPDWISTGQKRPGYKRRLMRPLEWTPEGMV